VPDPACPSRVSGLTKITDHVYWLPPAPPDRPSLCAVAGERRTLFLDAGSSPAHTRELLDGLSAEGVAPPSEVVFTHSHWDHVFGAAELDAVVVAHRLTAESLIELAATDWSDEALDGRVAAGEVSPEHAANVKAELPSPRDVRVAPADIVFDEGLDFHLGGVTVRARHVGGDHAADSCVMFVDPDRVLFLGDSLYSSPDGRLTAELTSPLHETILAFDAELFVDGHSESVLARQELELLIEKMRAAARAVREGSAISDADQDTEYFVQAFRAGRRAV
jgi:glyoxylase-like metal-dependent hydrolase (beta-lactamase superfamily II)